MKIAHIRHALATALDGFKSGGVPATHVLSAIEALIEEKNALQQERPSFADWTSDHVRDNLHKLKPQPAQQDIPDLIAGALGVSRGTAYDMMREALAEQPAKPYRQLQDNGSKYFDESWDKEEQPAQQEPVAGKGKELSERLKLCARNVAFVAAGRVDMSSAAMQEMFALIDQVCVGIDSPPAQQEPVAWVRRHPDGAFTAEFLENAVIEPVRKKSGAWFPLYTSPPAQKEPVKQVTIADAPSCLNTHDKAMWVLGWNECAEAAPAQRKPLTDEEIKAASLQAGMQEHYMGFHSGFIRFARAIEAAHNIKENT